MSQKGNRPLKQYHQQSYPQQVPRMYQPAIVANYRQAAGVLAQGGAMAMGGAARPSWWG